MGGSRSQRVGDTIQSALPLLGSEGADFVPPSSLSPLPVWLNPRSLHHSRLPFTRKTLEIRCDVRGSAFPTHGPIPALALPLKTCTWDLPLALPGGLPGGGGTFRSPGLLGTLAIVPPTWLGLFKSCNSQGSLYLSDQPCCLIFSVFEVYEVYFSVYEGSACLCPWPPLVLSLCPSQCLPACSLTLWFPCSVQALFKLLGLSRTSAPRPPVLLGPPCWAYPLHLR